MFTIWRVDCTSHCVLKTNFFFLTRRQREQQQLMALSAFSAAGMDNIFLQKLKARKIVHPKDLSAYLTDFKPRRRKDKTTTRKTKTTTLSGSDNLMGTSTTTVKTHVSSKENIAESSEFL